MADFVVWGIEEGTCRPNGVGSEGVGCVHPVAVHSINSDGCSHIGTSGWCECEWYPERTGAAQLLEDSIGGRYIAGSVRTR